MNNKTRNIIGAGATLLTAALLLNNCKEMPKSGEAAENDSDLESETREVRKRITSIFSENNWPGIGDLDNEEFKVKVNIVDGELAEDFNAVNAVRDCIESSGQYICADRPDEDSTVCYPSERKDGAVPLYIQEPKGLIFKIGVNGELMDFERQTGRMHFSVGLADTNYDFNKDDPEDTESTLNMLCNDAINYKNEYISHEEFCDGNDGKFCEDFYLRSLQFGELADELENSSDDIYYQLRENGFEVNDNGGSNFDVSIGERVFTLNRNMMYEDAEEEGEFDAFMAYEIVLGNEAPISMKDSEEVILGFEYIKELLAEE